MPSLTFKACKWCKKQFRQERATHSFCSKRCSLLHLNQAGPTHPKWKGGQLTKDGYRLLSPSCFPKEHADMLKSMSVRVKGTGEYRLLEHRAVMAITLKRALQPNETVHHKNGIRSDNQRSNLELRVSRHGPGATASSILCPHCGRSYDGV